MAKAKDFSKVVKVVSCIGLIACCVLKWLGFFGDVSISEICTVWATVYAVGAGSIDMNILADKFSTNGGSKKKENG